MGVEKSLVVTVPKDKAMQTEPATVIAKANSTKVALVAVLAVVGITISPELSANIDTLIQTGVAVAFGLYGVWTTWKQGQETRDAVYSPASVDRIATAAERGEVTVLPGDPKHADV